VTIKCKYDFRNKSVTTIIASLIKKEAGVTPTSLIPPLLSSFILFPSPAPTTSILFFTSYREAISSITPEQTLTLALDFFFLSVPEQFFGH